MGSNLYGYSDAQLQMHYGWLAGTENIQFAEDEESNVSSCKDRRHLPVRPMKARRSRLTASVSSVSFMLA